MRIIEPHQFSKKPAKKPGKQAVSPKTSALILIGLVGVASYLSVGQRVGFNDSASFTGVASQVLPESQAEDENAQPKKLKNFSGEEFKKLYNSASYPNTQQLANPPEITGNEAADNRIRTLAESRGYKLSAVPVSSIVRLNEPYLDKDDLIQPHALLAWQAMETAASNAGIPLQITSAYRSIEFQRNLFLDRLFARGTSILQIANGTADTDLLIVLERAAPPGYSRHHTGYTIDLACDGVGLESFVETPCYVWLSTNNYQQAKTYGWVPSYPQGAAMQGPEPETWEYIWVGKDVLYEQ